MRSSGLHFIEAAKARSSALGWEQSYDATAPLFSRAALPAPRIACSRPALGPSAPYCIHGAVCLASLTPSFGGSVARMGCLYPERARPVTNTAL